MIHNAEFDLSHLNNELALLGKKKINEEVVDTLVIAREKFPGSGTSLDALCKRYNIDNSRREKHNALIDCELLTKVYINLIDQKEPTFDLGSENNNYEISKNSITKYSKKIIKPTADELRGHKDYLQKSLKKNYF